MPAKPSPTIVEQVYRTILEAICDGRLTPGERLTQESVARKLSVSRQPVGQALLLLKQQKFVTEAGRRGLMVAPLDRDFMRSIYELRLGIEPLAASLAAAHATADDIARGERMIAAGKEAIRHNSIAELIAADMAFHMYLYELSRNRLFVELMQELVSDYSIVIVTHNMQQAARVSDRTAFFTVDVRDDGQRTGVLVEYDQTEKIFTNPSDPRTEDYVTGRFG